MITIACAPPLKGRRWIGHGWHTGQGWWALGHLLPITVAGGFKIECPTGSGHVMNLFEVAREISERLTRIFLRDERGRRPVHGATEKFQSNPHWRDHLLFYEYFHGDNGAGLGASHQTGWTGVIARIMHIFGTITPEQFLEGGMADAFRKR